MSKTIPLTQGYETIVDDEDYEILSNHKWSVNKFSKTCYAVRGVARRDGSIKKIIMHRVLMNAKKGEFVDHINGNGLDNRKHNLRICGLAENCKNRGPNKNSSSQYKGVSWCKSKNLWVAQIMISGKGKTIGRFCDEKEAAKAYDSVCKEIHGEFAWLNFPAEISESDEADSTETKDPAPASSKEKEEIEARNGS